MKYEDFLFKIPVESIDYENHSNYVVNHIENIIKSTIERGENKIFINTNLKLGLPMENINNPLCQDSCHP